MILDSINPITYSKTAKKINDFKPDLLLSNFWIPYLGPALTGVCKRVHTGCKKIAILHNVVPHESRLFDTSLTKKFLNVNDGFVVMSEHVKSNLLKFMPDANCSIKHHPFYDHFGVKIEKETARNELGIPTDKKILLFFGFIRKYKGLDLLLDAMQHLSADYHLIIAGESYENFEHYQKIIDKHQLSANITLFNQYIPHSDVKRYFSASDLVVLPYRSATQSGIVPVAYHFNIPVMATDVGGLKENIVDKKTGFILKENNPEYIANKIKSFFPIGEEYAQEIEELKQQNSWSSFADEVIRLYDRL